MKQTRTSQPHVGEILRELWMESAALTITETAEMLNIPPETMSDLVDGKISLTPEMALRLELAFGKSAESWLAIQAAYDVWQLEHQRNSLEVQRWIEPFEMLNRLDTKQIINIWRNAC